MEQYVAIDGMHCNGCVSRVKNSLESMEGIQEAEVTLHPGQAIIKSDRLFTSEQVEIHLSSIGNYTAEVLDEPRKESPPAMIELDVVEDKGPGIYYCPMLCEGDKTYDHFRDCPVCGMDLVKDQVASNNMYDDDEDKTYTDLRIKLIISVLFTLPILIISMGEMIGIPVHSFASANVTAWIQFLLSLPVVFYTCWNFFLRGFRSLINRSPNMWTLILVGAGSAFAFSFLGLVFPSLFPESFRDINGNVYLYFESTVVILTLVLLGQLIEARAHRRTGSAIKSLIQLVPPQALVFRDGVESLINIEDIQVGETIIIKPGEKIPVDGYLIEGTGVLDESMISGEPIPVSKSPVDPVIGGTINQSGSFKMRAEKVGSETLLAQIIQLVASASKSRAPIQKLADKIAFYFVPIVVSIAIVSFIVWGVVGPEPKWVYALTSAISVLIIACPCALGLATPMSIMVGTGRGAKEGILFKNAETLEQLNDIDTLVIDKTGTLTEGRPAFNAVITNDQWEEGDLIQWIASIENLSEHPISQALVDEAKKRNLRLLKCDQFTSITGKGLKGTLNGIHIVVGNLTLMQEENIAVNSQMLEWASKCQREGEMVVLVGINGKLAGMVSISDPIKKESGKAIKVLKSHGIEIIMMTGDVEITAQKVAGELGIDQYHSGMLPMDKYKAIQHLQSNGKKVAMAGDGINDAPSLALADVGIAMGNGTDVAIESADMTLVKGDVTGIVKALNLSNSVMKNIRQNLFFAFIYNAIGIPIAAGVLFPFIGVLLSPMLAALAMSLSSVSVISNSLRLQQKSI